MGSDLVGEKLGKYELTARLAGGPLAEVYRAYDPSLGREVALKVYRPHLASDPALIERLRTEARRVAGLRHPHIARIYDCDVAVVAGQPILYVVSEFAEGATLKDRLAALKASGQMMPLTDVVALVQAIASALDYAHSRGVTHGGLKPANVLFTAEGEPVVTDFGMARAASAAVQALPADPAGAPAYMAPEQIKGEPIDGRADVYALGVLLYELCTNTLPFTADTATGVLMRHLTEPPPPPTRANPDLPLAVEQVILQALSKAPADRYQKAEDLATALEAALSGAAPLLPAPAEATAPATISKAGAILSTLSSLAGKEEEEAPKPPAAREAEKGSREGIRNFLVGLMALFTAALTLIERFLKAIDILRNPLVGLIVVGVAVGAMVISAGYVLARPRLYQRWQRRLAAIGLALTMLAAAGWGGWTLYDIKRPPKGLILLIADFERDPGARAVNYARRLEAGLNEALNQFKVAGVYVERAYETYTEKDARAKAAARKAAVVIYGWYDDAGVNPRFELVRAPQQHLPLLKQATVGLADLDQLEIRVDKELQEMNYIAMAAIGLAYYADGQYNQALTFFDLALKSAPEEARLMGREAVYFYKGASYFYLHQFPQALAALQEAVRLNPDLYAVRHNLAIAYSFNCEYAAALRENEEALRLKPDSGDAYYFRGVLLMSKGRWEEAASALTKATELSPDNTAVHIALGQVYKQLGRADEAAAEHQKAMSLAEEGLREKADDPQAIAARADVLWSQGKLKEAVAEYQRAIEVGVHGHAPLQPDHLAWLYRSLGRAYLDLERWTEAMEIYNQAIALSPGLYSDYTSLGLAYQHLGQLDQAMAAYQQALALQPCDANTHNLLGELYQKLGKAEEALQEYQAAAQYAPDDFTAWHALGQILEKRGEMDEAKAAYEKAVALAESYLQQNPRDAAVTSMVGLMYLLLGKTPQAIPMLEKAATLQPNADNHYALGNAYYEAGQFDEALAEYQAALAADPKHFDSAVRLGDTYEKLGRTDEAIAAYRQALAFKDDADVHAYLGMLLAKQGRTAEAEAEYQASLRLADNALAHFGLADLHERAGQVDQAIAELQAALKFSDEAETHAALARLYEVQGRLEEAAGEYQAAIARSGPETPDQDRSRAALASVLLRLCRADEALAALQPSLARDPKSLSAEVMAALAAIYEAQGKATEASEVYAALLQQAPDLPVVHYLAAWFTYRQGHLDEAAQEMERVTILAPTSSLAWSSLGYLRDLQGDLAAAREAHEKALELMPANVSALLGLGAIALQQNDPATALGYFQEALQWQPEYVKAVPDEAQTVLISIHFYLALAYERLGQAEEAGQELATARQLAEAAVAVLPSHPLARFYLEVAYWLVGETEAAEAAFAEAARCNASLVGERAQVEGRLRELRGR